MTRGRSQGVISSLGFSSRITLPCRFVKQVGMEFVMSRFVALLAAFAVCSLRLGQNVSFECYPLGSLAQRPCGRLRGRRLEQPGLRTGVSSTTSAGSRPRAPVREHHRERTDRRADRRAISEACSQHRHRGPRPDSDGRVVHLVRLGVLQPRVSDDPTSTTACRSTVVDAGAQLPSAPRVRRQLLTEAVCIQAGLRLCQGPISEVVPAGPKASSPGPSAAHPACAYVSIVVWNGSDNAVPSQAYVDNIQFNSAVPVARCRASSSAPSLRRWCSVRRAVRAASS